MRVSPPLDCKTQNMFASVPKKEQKSKPMLFPFFFLVFSSLFFSVLTVCDLEWESSVPIRKGVLLFIYGLVYFTSLFIALNHMMLRTSSGQKFMKRYNLTAADILDISNKQVSAVQAFFCCVTGITVCLYSCTRDMLKTSHYISEAYAWFGAAYFFYDIWSMYKVHITKRHQHKAINGDSSKCKKVNAFTNFLIYTRDHAVIVGHHIFIGAFGFLVITYLRGGLGDCFFGFVYLMEASTPFVSARGVLSKVGLKDSRLYVVNGITMLVTFFICRVAMFPYVIYLYAQSVNLDYMSAVMSLPRGCKISILILLLPQIYWFVLMINGATKILKPKIVANITSNKRKLVKNIHS